MDQDDREWKEAMFQGAISDPQLKSLAWKMAEGLVSDGDPVLGEGDLQAARRYLRKCMLNMSVYELQTVTRHELAGLLARGTLGAARYRANRGGGGPINGVAAGRQRRLRAPGR